MNIMPARSTELWQHFQTSAKINHPSFSQYLHDFCSRSSRYPPPFWRGVLGQSGLRARHLLQLPSSWPAVSWWQHGKDQSHFPKDYTKDPSTIHFVFLYRIRSSRRANVCLCLCSQSSSFGLSSSPLQSVFQLSLNSISSLLELSLSSQNIIQQTDVVLLCSIVSVP